LTPLGAAGCRGTLPIAAGGIKAREDTLQAQVEAVQD